MFKRKTKYLPLELSHQRKLKTKILPLTVAILIISLLILDVINAVTRNHENEVTVFIKNIHLLAPFGLAYLLASRQRELLKVFSSLYMSLVLLVASFSHAFQQFAKSQDLVKKFAQEAVHLVTEQADFLGKIETFSQTYSADDYGHFAVYLNRFKKLINLYKQEYVAVVQTFNEAELDKFFTEELLFNFFNIFEKKKELEKLSLFVDQSAQRTEDIYSDYVTWLLSSPEVDEMSRKNFAQAISTSPEEKKFFRQEPYRMKKNIVQEHIILLDILSKAFGSYEIGENGRIVFYNDKDLQAWNSHCETLENLFKEENNFFLTSQEKLGEEEKSLLTK